MNGKLGTYHTAHIAANAFIIVIIIHLDNVVAFTIGLVTFVQQVLRAKLDTEAAALAPLRHHRDLVLFGFSHAVAQ